MAVACGGSGGHVFPALAVAEALEEEGVETVFLIPPGQGGWLPQGARVQRVSSGRVVGMGPRAALGVAVSLLGSVQALRFLRARRVAALFSTGGFASVPAILAARALGIPILLHEPNARLGRATSLALRLGSHVCLGLPVDLHALGLGGVAPGRVRYTGTPVRGRVLRGLKELGKEEARLALGLHSRPPLVLVLGGSQGARALNRAALTLARELGRSGEAEILLVSGTRLYGETMAALEKGGGGPGLHVVPYLDRVELALAAADLALSRAGGSTLAELAVAGVPAILVPYRHALAHQTANALVWAERGAGLVLPEADLESGALVREVGTMLASEERLKGMAAAARSLARPEAAREVAGWVLELAKGARKDRRWG